MAEDSNGPTAPINIAEDTIELANGEQVQLPRGTHLDVFEGRTPLANAGEHPLTLQLADGGEVILLPGEAARVFCGPDGRFVRVERVE